MAFRTVLIEKAISVRLDLDNVVVDYENEKFWININEINILIIDDPRCNVSLRLLSYLCEKEVTVVFCNNSHMPIGTMQSLSIHSRSFKKIKSQISWDESILNLLWTEIIKGKISNQKENLEILNKNNKIPVIDKLLYDIECGDPKNREGTVSRIYFKEMFGESFTRDQENIINSCLNYIYQVVRSKISQEIIALGYIPELGIHHKSEFNSFNLADDLIEPFRPICDYYVYKIIQKYDYEFINTDIKHTLVNIVNQNINYNNCSYKLYSVIQFYIQNIFLFLETGDLSKIIIPKL